MTYLEMVCNDVKEWVEDNKSYISYGDFDNVDDFESYLNDELFCEDSVTGNASGSYTFNRCEAKNLVLDNVDEVKEALEEFGTPADIIAEHFLSEDWEYFDVTARCGVLGQAIAQYISDYESDILNAIDEAHEESNN